VVDDLQDLDEAEGGPKPPQGRLLSGSSSAMAEPLPLWWLVASSSQIQVQPAALELELVDLALAVVIAPSLERQQFGVPRERQEGMVVRSTSGATGWDATRQ
jgi:hypothetical protein